MKTGKNTPKVKHVPGSLENRFIKVATLAPFVTSLLLPKYIWLDSADENYL